MRALFALPNMRLSGTEIAALTWVLVVLVDAACLARSDLVGVNNVNGELVWINTNTGELTSIGPTGASILNGLAFIPETSTLYGVHPFEGRLYQINTSSGAASPVGAIGAIGLFNVNALAYDPVGKRFLSADINTDSLISIDPVSGIGEVIAPLSGPVDEIEGLAYDPIASVLYGISDEDDRSPNRQIRPLDFIPLCSLCALCFPQKPGNIPHARAFDFM